MRSRKVSRILYDGELLCDSIVVACDSADARETGFRRDLRRWFVAAEESKQKISRGPFSGGNSRDAYFSVNLRHTHSFTHLVSVNMVIVQDAV